jgi:ABC-type cobalamin/Fe3+-siderophores transport system ATPase subunit
VIGNTDGPGERQEYTAVRAIHDLIVASRYADNVIMLKEGE